MAEHRPEIHRLLIDSLVQAGEVEFAIVRGKYGRWTLASISPTIRPFRPRCRRCRTEARLEIRQGAGGLRTRRWECAFRDWRTFPPSCRSAASTRVYLIEPRTDLVLSLLVCTISPTPTGRSDKKDSSGRSGADWQRQFRQFFLDNPAVIFPESQIGQGPDIAAIDSQLRKTLVELVEHDRELAKQSTRFMQRFRRGN